MTGKSLKGIIPFPLRVELARLRRWPRWVLEASHMARGRAEQPESFGVVLAKHCSPLRRSPDVDQALQAGKEHNVALATAKLNGVVVEPGQVFSYHHCVGRPSRLRGFRMGLELHAGEMSKGLGGGCCQISNMLYLLAIRSGMDIIERHRHALDLFPDHERKVPFGCGATVFYNFADLRFRNPHEVPVLVSLGIEDGVLNGSFRSQSPLSFRVEIYEKDHRFYRDGEAWHRENRICRRLVSPEGTVVKDEELAHNRGRCLYDPEEHA